ncbi:MAG: segregation/condensation protein A [Parcubacteria group bacterium]|jgi:segregation and condensation protein A
MTYHFKSEKFEGPLDLLLELIEKEEMQITELSLANVADQYLEYIKNNQNIQLDNLAEFLSVASKLILIKSRALLPILEFSQEEEAEIKDLAKQLEEYKKFKEAAMALGKIAERGRISYAREGFSGIKTFFYPPENMNVFDFKKYFQAVLAEIPQIEKLEEEIVREVMTLEEKINDLQNVLRQRIETSFADLTAGAVDKVEVIVSFLAMLEMVKQRIIEVDQDELFRDIKLKVKTVV